MKPYRRKLSAGEARGQFMLITKDRWKHFPPPGQPFDLRLGDELYRVAIEAIPCHCVGMPHEHYHLGLTELTPLLEWVRGATFVIEPESEGGYAIAQEART